MEEWPHLVLGDFELRNSFTRGERVHFDLHRGQWYNGTLRVYYDTAAICQVTECTSLRRRFGSVLISSRILVLPF